MFEQLVESSLKSNNFLGIKTAQFHINKKCNSFNALPGLLELKYPVLSKTDFLKLLGENWTWFDEITIYKNELKKIIGTKRNNLIMFETEKTAYNELEDKIKIYRYASENHEAGICWSVDKNTALQFSTYPRFQCENSFIYSATVKKKFIVALKLDRDEKEIITFKPENIQAESI